MRTLLSFLVLVAAAFGATGDITAVRISGQTQRGVTDAAMTSGTATLTSATASFVAGDLGKDVYVAGAGTSGGLLKAQISGVTDGSTVTLSANAASTVSAAKAWIGDYRNGFVAEIDIAGLNTGGAYSMGLGANLDPAGATLVFTVTSPGYTGTTLGTRTRTVVGTRQLRRTAPEQAQNEETSGGGTLTVRVALSDFIYAGDTLTVSIAANLYCDDGAACAADHHSNAVTSLEVTNHSTLAYSDTQALGRWVRPVPFDKVSGSFTLEALAISRFARGGKPVQQVDFTCSDGAITVGPYTAAAMTVSDMAGDQNPVLVYQATVDPSPLAQGAITCNFKAYPWIGDATAVLDSNSGIAQPDSGGRLGNLALLNDKGTYGGGWAVVDAVNGHASSASTWVAAGQSAAETAYTGNSANSYTTLDFAAAAIKAWNNANLGRNEPGGGGVLLTGTTNDLGAANTSLGAMATYLTVTHLSTATRADAALTSGGSGHSPGVQKIRYYDISLNDGGVANMLWEVASSAVLWVDKCALSMTGASGWAVGYTNGYATRNTISAMGNRGFGYANGLRWPLVRGNETLNDNGDTFAASAHAMVGNRNLHPMFDLNAQITDNAIVAFNSHYRYGVHSSAMWADMGYTQTRGIAFVQNLVEVVNNAGTFAINNNADANTKPTNNVIFWHNVAAGQRGNFGYNWSAAGTNGAQAQKNWSLVGNIFDGWNDKSDAQAVPANGAATGNWPLTYGVGRVGTEMRFTVNAGGVIDDNFVGLLSVNDSGATPGVAFHDFTTCAAYAYQGNGCSGLGNGNYHLLSDATALNRIPSGFAVLPYDLGGTARKNDGTGAAGAYEYAPAGTRSPRSVVWH